ncbi:hypothetical protein ACFWF7_14735 [Nocardia sp. NPDC060256]|uniref:hypothetical protein n=1 Tax=Nocardia sp. NPDC060256 TaxID=3347086 RepID=UPI00364A0D94
MRRTGGSWSPEPAPGAENRDDFGLSELISEPGERGSGPSRFGPAGRRGNSGVSPPDSRWPCGETPDSGERCDGGPSRFSPAGRRGGCPESLELTDDTADERGGTLDSFELTDDTDAGPRCDCPATIFESGVERDDVWIPPLGVCDTEPSLAGDGRVAGGSPAGPSLARLITDEPRLSTDWFDDDALDGGDPSEADELPLLPE